MVSNEGSGDIGRGKNITWSYGGTINMTAFRGELNWALTRVLQLSYQRPIKRHSAHTVKGKGERCLIRRLSEKGKAGI